MAANAASVARFNASQRKWRVQVEILPQGAYTETITAAALAGRLPCVFDMDQPLVPNFAWAGYLSPLDDLMPSDMRADLLPGGQSRFRGRTYAVGQFDVALALFARRSELKALGIRIATAEAPYTADELMGLLAKAKAATPHQYPIDINTALRGEWISYAFGPWLQSAGADLIDRKSLAQAEGTLNSPAAIRAVKWYGQLFREAYTERQATDDRAFLFRRSTFHYSGSWVAASYRSAFGDDLAIMPPPDFGAGPRVGAGSWQWGISSSCQDVDGAAAFLKHLMLPTEIARFVDATGFVPTSRRAAMLSRDFRPGQPWRVFFDFEDHWGTPRPETPGYPRISSAFEKAMLDVRDGVLAEDALDDAAGLIDRDIRRNRGYGL